MFAIRYIERLRAVSCIAVVILHTALTAAGSFELTDGQRMWTMLLRNMMLWAVPCFIMVTGALLLDPGRNVSYKKLVFQYVKRIFICILLFTAVFEIFDLILFHQTPGWWTVKEYLYKVVAGRSWSHMWYLYMLIGLYLLLPFYRMIVSVAQKQDMVYLIIIYFVFLSVLPLLRTIFDIEIAFFICVSAVYPLYLFLGYYIHCGQLRIPMGLLLALLVVSTAGIGGTTVAAYAFQIDSLKTALGTYSFPLTLIQAVCIFSVFANAKGMRNESHFWSVLDRLSFGVYLFHMIFLKLLYVGIGYNPYRHGGGILLIPIALSVFIVSCITVRLLILSKWARRIL